MAVSASLTTCSTLALKPGWTDIGGTLRRSTVPRPARAGDTHRVVVVTEASGGGRPAGPALRRSEDPPGPGQAERRGSSVIEEAVLQRVLGSALKTGGEFAEVFAEDRRSASARLDDAKVEEFVSGLSLIHI